MQLNQSIRENLRFLLVEVAGQLEGLIAFLVNQDRAAGQRILHRGGYTENLKRRIHQGCLEQLQLAADSAAQPSLQLRATETVASELELIGDLCRDSASQLGELDSTDAINAKYHAKRLHEVSTGLGLVLSALEGQDIGQAQRLAKLETRLDRRCRKMHSTYSKRLREHSKTKQLIAGLFIARNIGQMGHCLLNISDAIVSSALGQPMNLRRYNSLQTSLASLERHQQRHGLHVEPLAETRSGSAISAISADSPDAANYLAIFKDGEERKLKEERDGVASWHEIYPGLAPRIIDYHKRGQSAALLIEHLSGLTLERILLQESDQLLQQALKRLGKTLRSVWRETLAERPISADFIGQTQNRLAEVYAVHPEFQRGSSRLCGVEQIGFDRLLAQARQYESQIQAPFSVYIHGDFNIDNIIYDPAQRQIRFIDLHRSRHMDYVQDVSVFMVSNYRLQILDAPLRRRIMATALALYRIAADFAHQQGDQGFELRLALGLARSFVTSTRFILDESLASSMFLRARYLLEQVLRLEPRQAADYRIPLQEIFIG
jgi:phosphate uptake regulator/Ser/Thr protein kinase RdoA (MazF antagonist)